MFPKKHIIHGFLFTLFLYITLGIPEIMPFVIIFFSTFLFDVDHYLAYIIRKKDFSFKKSYRFFVESRYKAIEKPKKRPFLFISHTIEFLILMIILSFFNKTILYMTIGLLFHSILDFHQLAKENRLYEREYSMIKFFFEWMI